MRDARYYTKYFVIRRQFVKSEQTHAISKQYRCEARESLTPFEQTLLQITEIIRSDSRREQSRR